MSKTTERTAYHFNYETKDYSHLELLHAPIWADEPALPQMAVWIEPPSFNSITETCKINDTKDGWVVSLKFIEVTAYSKTDKSEKKFDDKSLVDVDHTIVKYSSIFDDWVVDKWVLNKDKAFGSEMDALNEQHYQDVLAATNQYNIAVARDGSTESTKVAAARARIADVDAKFDLDQLAIINKYYGV